MAKILPNEYRQLEYIQSTGTQYIDTGVTGTVDTSFELIYSQTSIGNVFGYRDAAASNNISYWTGNPNIFYIDFNNSDYDSYRLQLNDVSSYFNNKLKIESSKSLRKITNLDTSTVLGQNTVLNSDTITTGNLYLLNMNGNSYIPDLPSAKVYSCKISNGSTLQRDLVPAKRISDSVVGMYDLVSKQFFTNSGTGTFTPGPEVPTTEIKYVKKRVYVQESSVIPGQTLHNIKQKRYVVNGSGLPSGYTRLEYIEAVGTGTSSASLYYIDTGVAGSLDTEIETEIKHISSDANLFTIVASNKNSTGGIILSHYSSGPAWAPKFGNIGFSNKGNITRDTWQTVLMNKDALYVNGVSKGDINATTMSDTTNLFIMCDVWNSPIVNTTKLQMKNFIIRKSGTVVFNGIACKHTSDNKCGFYDTVSGTFKENAGTGSYTPGPETSILQVITVNETRYAIGG